MKMRSIISELAIAFSVTFAVVRTLVLSFVS